MQQAEVVDGERQLDFLELAADLLVLTGTRGLALERLELTVDLSCDIVNALQLDVHVLELAAAALFALLVLEDAGGLLDEEPAVFGTCAQHVLQRALADDGVRVAPQTRVVEDVEHVHQARWRAVDEVLAFAAAVHAARDDDLVEVKGKRAVGVVEHQVDLGEPDGLARGGTREDDVFHRLPAQLLGALLAEYPQHGVGHVGLAGAVRPDDDGHARLQLEDRTVRKRLEALEYKRFEIHGCPWFLADIHGGHSTTRHLRLPQLSVRIARCQVLAAAEPGATDPQA